MARIILSFLIYLTIFLSPTSSISTEPVDAREENNYINPARGRYLYNHRVRHSPLYNNINTDSNKESVESSHYDSTFSHESRGEDIESGETKLIKDERLTNSIVKVSNNNRACQGCATERRNQEVLQSASKTNELPEETLRKLRIEEIMAKILRKLRLDQAPTGIVNDDLPKVLDAQLSHFSTKTKSIDMEEFFGKTEQVIIFPEDVQPSTNCAAKRNVLSACLTFALPKEIIGKTIEAEVKVSSAELWVYKLPNDDNWNQTLTVDEILGNSITSLEKRNVNQTDGWENLNVTRTISNWISKNLVHDKWKHASHPLQLQISCKNCVNNTNLDSPIDIANSTNRPFLIINVAGSAQKTRKRRSTNCHDGMSECCREPLKLKFHDIGWDWIHTPTEFDAYYCKGSCIGSTGNTHSSSRHTTARQDLIRTRGVTNYTEQLVPCCVPKRLSTISIIYRASNNTMVKEDLPNMIVESCGCN